MGSANPHEHRRRAFAALCLVSVTVLAYFPALSAGFVWDDDKYVTDNRTLRTVDGLEVIWSQPLALPQYYPLVFSTFWVEYQIWGDNPFGYHLVNVLLHAATAILFWRFLSRLSFPAAYLSALLFALHPVHVESVAWITERKNVLSGFFYVVTSLAYLRFYALHRSRAAQGGNPVAFRRPATEWACWVWYGIASLGFICALLSKTVTCSVPAALLLVIWWKHGYIRLRDVGPLVPWVIAGAVMGLLTAWLEHHHVGAMGVQWELSFLERSLIAGRAVWFYLAKLIWPVHLCFVYPRWQVDLGVWWQYLFPVALFVCVASLWKFRTHIGRGPIVVLLMFIGTLFPALGFFDVYPMQFSFVADHFQYHATFGVLALAGSGLHGVQRLLYSPTRALIVNERAQQRRPVLSTLIVATVLLGLAVTTWRQSHNYRDLETLWRATLSQNPRAWLAQANLGLLLIEKGEQDEAFELLAQARKTGVDNAHVRLAYAYALVRCGRLESAFAELSDFVASHPASARAHALLGAVEAKRSNINNALSHYREALRLMPDLREARSELAFMLLNEGYAEDAVRQYRELLEYDPKDTSVMMQLGQALRAAGQHDEALQWLRRVKERPNDGAPRLGNSNDTSNADSRRLEREPLESNPAIINRENATSP